MHEYLHKYFENNKKVGKNFSVRNMRPLSNASPLPPRGRGVRGFFLRLWAVFNYLYSVWQWDRYRVPQNVFLINTRSPVMLFMSIWRDYIYYNYVYT